MKILMITPYLPYPLYSGGQIRSYNLIKNLAKTHQITLFSFVKEVVPAHVKELDKYCRKIEVFKRRKAWSFANILISGFSFYPFLVAIYYSLSLKQRIKEELSKEKYDLIHAETFYVMPNIPKTSVPILLIEQTIEYLVYDHFLQSMKYKFFKPLLAVDVFKIKFWERYFWKRADEVVAMSDSDKQKMKKLVPDLSVEIIPNGVDSLFFEKAKKIKRTSPTILFVGNFSWLQNREAIFLLIDRIWPLVKNKINNAKLLIVGKNPTKKVRKLAQNNDIEVKDNVSDIRSAYQNADIMLAPIFGPGGTRYKILEAMASNLPVVTTEKGVEGIPAKNGCEILIGNSAEELADLTVDLLKNRNLMEKISKNAKFLVKNKFDWQRISTDLDRVYKEVGGRK